ncbi:hypothetical protein FV226_24575 [Methylobacterium sp. WL12]|uniref:carbohydrate-binding domain-containing protein n=1 Tax=Methylobacterium sp. WL12 TaxID=2603890 RepID=UPI0011CB6880|nr:carbohydrate-binding domain-containing protein [Methylobacterium sp. WL12]TXM65671.1 hypothetical protein FV226_24575 [Methylobacterium sp. WL12]
MTTYSGAQKAQDQTITNNGGEIIFLDHSSAANSSLTNENSGTINFKDLSTADMSNLIKNRYGTINFSGEATAGSASIVNNTNHYPGVPDPWTSSTTFTGNSTAGTAKILNNGGDSLSFENNSSAGSSNVDNQGYLIFNDKSTAGNSIIRYGYDFKSGGGMEFLDQSSAGSATIYNSEKNIHFSANSTAGQSNILLGSYGASVKFSDSSTAGSSIVNSQVGYIGGHVDFEGNSSADKSIINGAVVAFSGHSTAGFATIKDGYVDFSSSLGTDGDGKVSVGSIVDSRVYLGSTQLTIGSTNADSKLIGAYDGPGPITGSGGSNGSLVKVGTGTLTLLGELGDRGPIYTGGTTLVGGTLVLASEHAAGTGAITFTSGAQTLQVAQSAFGGAGGTLENTLSGFGLEDTLDLAGVAYAAGAKATLAGNTLTVTSGGVSDSFVLSNYDTNHPFQVTSDGSGGLQVRYSTQSLPQGPDTLVVRASEDAFKGDAHFIVKVDGQQIGGVQVAHASHAQGQWENITLHGSFASANRVAVEFVDDLNAGAGQDRNLYVDSINLNGTTYKGSDASVPHGQGQTTYSAELWTNASAVFSTGPDTLHFRVSEDAYKGDAHFIVLVDGQQVGGVQVAHASHAQGHWDDITLHGSFAGANHVAVEFVNDLYAGAGQDRNLYVDSISLDGHVIQGRDATVAKGIGQTIYSAELWTNGSADFNVSSLHHADLMA